jgi:hypothetical protein
MKLPLELKYDGGRMPVIDANRVIQFNLHSMSVEEAESVVRAINSHNALVEAVEELVNGFDAIEYGCTDVLDLVAPGSKLRAALDIAQGRNT